MASSNKIASVVPSNLVGAVSDHLPDQLTHLPDQLTRLPDQLSRLPDQFSRLPDQLSHIPDRLPDLPDFPVNVSDLTGRLRNATDTAGSVVSDVGHRVSGQVSERKGAMARFGLPALVLAIVSIGILAYWRSRQSNPSRSSTESTSATPAHVS